LQGPARAIFCPVTTLAEIEKAVDALPPGQQQALLRRLSENLARRKDGPVVHETWPVPPPDVPMEELKRIHALIETEFSKVDPNGW
jgi:hypothetical protein